MENKITPDDYQKQDWVIHALAPDFKLRDCWRLPVRTSEPFKQFLPIFLRANPADSHPVVRMLFNLRIAIGNMFKLDQSPAPIPKTGERSISERLAKNEVSFELFQMPEGSSPAPFRPVYLRENEALLELSNKTIYALIHLGKTGDEIWFGIYTKSYSALSDLYMTLIKPFRHFVVYPLWLRHIQAVWENETRPGHGR